LKRVKKPVLFQFQPFYSGCWIPKKSEEVSIPISQVDKYLLQTIFLSNQICIQGWKMKKKRKFILYRLFLEAVENAQQDYIHPEKSIKFKVEYVLKYTFYLFK